MADWLLGDANTDFDHLDPNVYAAALAAAQAYGQPLSVISAFRSPEYQAQLRSQNPQATAAGRIAYDSQHSHGNALDFATAGMTPEDIARMAGYLADAGFSAFGQYGDHLHADYRGTVPGSFGVNSPTWGGWTELDPLVMAALTERGFQAGQPWQPVGSSGGDTLMEGQMDPAAQLLLSIMGGNNDTVPFMTGPDGQRYFAPPMAGAGTWGLDQILGLQPGTFAQGTAALPPGAANPTGAAATGEPGLPDLPSPVPAPGAAPLDPYAMYLQSLGAGRIDLGSMAMPTAPGSAAPVAGPDYSAIRELLAQAAPNTEPVAPQDEWIKYVLGLASGALSQPSDDIGAIIGGAGVGGLSGWLDAHTTADEMTRQKEEQFRQYLLGLAQAETGLAGSEYDARLRGQQQEQASLDRQYQHGVDISSLTRPDVNVNDGQIVVSGVDPTGQQYVEARPLGAHGERIYTDLQTRLASSGGLNILSIIDELGLTDDFEDRYGDLTGMISGERDDADVNNSLAAGLVAYARRDPQLLGQIQLMAGYTP